MQQTAAQKKGISGSTLKLIAIGVMFIDHIGAVILESGIMMSGCLGSLNDLSLGPAANLPLYLVYMLDSAMRLIGRLGFPLFCFLLMEGYQHTRSKVKYFVRLTLFAMLSEIPFDLALQHTPLEFTYQNVFFTLAIGFATVWGIDTVFKKCKECIKATFVNKVVHVLVVILISGIGMYIAHLLKTDYSEMGVLTIIVLFLLKHKSNVAGMVGACTTLCIMNLIEYPAFATIPLVMNYNGKRGMNVKYLFYFFYPVHLLLLYGILVLTGLI